MRRLTIGVVDFGAGNLASVRQSLHSMDYRCRVTNDPQVLDQADLLMLPGVGAFPAAMESLHSAGLVQYLTDQVHSGVPLVGICLGMQLLGDCSHEIKLTSGLGLIPGEVVPLAQSNWHIGWNNVEMLSQEPALAPGDGQAVYFNHSHIMQTEREFVTGVSRIDHASDTFAVVIQRNNVVGLQFHPEKSQQAGKLLLGSVIEGLCHA